MSHTCDFCDSSQVAEVLYDDVVAAGRRKLALTALRKNVCASCGEEFFTSEQAEHNHALFDAAVKTTAEAVTVGLLRTLRVRWGLTQRAASALFGAGQSSFGKWESGALPSGPAALLLQCAAHVPGVMEFLARLQNTPLPNCPELTDWRSDGEVTGGTPVLKLVKRHVASNTPAPSSHHLRYARNVVHLYGEAA